MNIRLSVLVGMIVSIGLFRLLPHPPNFTPMLAMALFAGARFDNPRLAFVVPFAAMFLADLMLGFHATMPYVYTALGLVVVLGLALGRRVTIVNTVAAALSGSLLFFVFTNFGAWLALPELYARTPAGLWTAYIAAIPFFQNQLLGDLLFTAVLFGGFEALRRAWPVIDHPPGAASA